MKINLKSLAVALVIWTILFHIVFATGYDLDTLSFFIMLVIMYAGELASIVVTGHEPFE